MAIVKDDGQMPRRPHYDWAKFTDGRYWILIRGIDFAETANIEWVRQAALNYGVRHDIRVSTMMLDDKGEQWSVRSGKRCDHLAVQALGPRKKKKTKPATGKQLREALAGFYGES